MRTLTASLAVLMLFAVPQFVATPSYAGAGKVGQEEAIETGIDGVVIKQLRCLAFPRFNVVNRNNYSISFTLNVKIRDRAGDVLDSLAKTYRLDPDMGEESKFIPTTCYRNVVYEFAATPR